MRLISSFFISHHSTFQLYHWLIAFASASLIACSPSNPPPDVAAAADGATSHDVVHDARDSAMLDAPTDGSIDTFSPDISDVLDAAQSMDLPADIAPTADAVLDTSDATDAGIRRDVEVDAGSVTTLRIHYPAGHTITVRGGSLPLNWGVGLPTTEDDTTYTLVVRGLSLDLPVAWKPMLDDAVYARGPNYHFLPGETVDISPHFNYAQGQVITLIPSFHSDVLGNDRVIYAYLPPSYVENPAATYPVVYMQDGENLWGSMPAIASGVPWNVDSTFDSAADAGGCSSNLYAGWGGPPVEEPPTSCTADDDCPSSMECRTFPEAIVIGVGTTSSRTFEYTPTTDPGTPGGGGAGSYVTMLTDELKPIVDSMLRTRPDAASTAIVGADLGALASAYASLQRPDVFGLVGEMSPRTPWNNSVIVNEIQGTSAAPNRPRIVYLDCGGGVGDNQFYTDQLSAAYLGLGYRTHVNYRYLVQDRGLPNSMFWRQRVWYAMQFLLGVR